MKDKADKKRRSIELEVGDAALVKLQPYRQSSLTLRKNQKLGLKFFGPFRVINKLSPVACKLELPESARIHPIFHISLLKKYKGDSFTPYLPLPLTTSEYGPILQPEEVLAARTIMKGSVLEPQVLIKWQGTTDSEATREGLKEFNREFPAFNLGDKVVFNGGGTVTCTAEVEKDDSKDT